MYAARFEPSLAAEQLNDFLSGKGLLDWWLTHIKLGFFNSLIICVSSAFKIALANIFPVTLSLSDAFRMDRDYMFSRVEARRGEEAAF